MSTTDALPEPWNRCYEWKTSPFGVHLSFSSNAWNGSRPTRTVELYTADQMRAALAAQADAKPGYAKKIESLIAERDALRAERDALKDDAERYRWLRGGPDVPTESTRWARWEVRHWCGRWWNTLFAEQLDAAIDAAREGSGK